MIRSFDVEMKEIYGRLQKGEKRPNIDNSAVYEEYINKLTSKPLILYGCGMGGYAVADWLNSLGVTVCGFADSKRAGVFPYDNSEIISLQKLLEEHKNKNVLISSKNYCEEIYKQLTEKGFPKEQLFLFPKLFPWQPTKNTKKVQEAETFLKEHLKGYAWAYNFFNDEESKKVVLERMYFYLFGTPLTASYNAPEYFDPSIITLGENEICVDAGGYYGDTVLAMIQNSNGKYKKIYTFEPELKKCKVMNAEFEQYENIEIISCGLWSENTSLKFSVSDFGPTSSFAYDVSEKYETIEVMSLDAFFEGKEAPSFIKMDIEGSELEALRGAKEIICKSKPKLAISAAHKQEDIYTLVALLSEYRPDYCFYLRQPIDGITESILYAI